MVFMTWITEQWKYTTKAHGTKLDMRLGIEEGGQEWIKRVLQVSCIKTVKYLTKKKAVVWQHIS